MTNPNSISLILIWDENSISKWTQQQTSKRELSRTKDRFGLYLDGLKGTWLIKKRCKVSITKCYAVCQWGTCPEARTSLRTRSFIVGGEYVAPAAVLLTKLDFIQNTTKNLLENAILIPQRNIGSLIKVYYR